MTQFRATTCAIVGIAMLSADAGVAVDAQSIDVELSTLTVHVSKTGLFSAFADNHVIRAPIAGGRISREETRAVELTVKAAQMTVLDPGLSADKRAEVQARMRGPEVLDSERYPDIRFVSTRIAPECADRWQVTCDLSLHGASRPLTFAVVRGHGRLRGTVSIRQRDFGIQPISIAGGTVKVKDDRRIEFEIVGAKRLPDDDVLVRSGRKVSIDKGR